jgi:origin recognition complex subunit 3
MEYLLMLKRDQTLLPTGFIVTGPNITSQGLIFDQLSTRLKDEIDGPVVLLRSGDAPHLKAILRKLIRDATNQRSWDDGEETIFEQGVGRHSLSLVRL